MVMIEKVMCVVYAAIIAWRPQLSRTLSYVIPLLLRATSTNAVEATGSLQAQYAKVCQARLVLCCLGGEIVVGNNDNSVLASSDRYWKRTMKLLYQHFHWKLYMTTLASQADPFYGCI